MSPEIFDEANILVVDDDDVMVDMIESALAEIGSKHHAHASNGIEGLKAYDTSKENSLINTILLDLNMPGMDGVEFMRHIAERKYEGEIILMSGEDKGILKSAGDLARAHQLSIADILEKPVSIAALQSAFEKIANKQEVVEKSSRPMVEVSEEELKTALEKDQIVMYFQPKVDVKTKKISSAESLVRWIHPKKGLIPPDAFISLSEQTGLIHELTQQVIQKALKQTGQWHAQGYDFKVAINVSVENLQSLELPEYIVEQAREYHVDPGKIIVEVTESQLMEDLAKTFEILTRIRLKGMELSIDDFGTGFSTMEQLERIPFTELKIDKLYITDADKKPKTRAILENSVSLGKSLGLRIVTEGVETQAEWDLVKSLGVDLVQGYFISKPLPADELTQWLISTGQK